MFKKTLNCNLICSWGPSGGHGEPKQSLSSLMPWAVPAPLSPSVTFICPGCEKRVQTEGRTGDQPSDSSHKTKRHFYLYLYGHV